MTTFIDAGAFVARYLPHDQFHAASLAAWDELQRAAEPCMTSNLVVAESLTFLGRRTDYVFAAQTGRALYDSRLLTILRPEFTDECTALDLMSKFADQRVSFTDCVTMALMRKHRIKRIFSFDRHFALAGLTLFPD